MCLYQTFLGTSTIKRRIANGTTTFYKVFRTNNKGEILNAFQAGAAQIDESGYLRSNRSTTVLTEGEIRKRQINHGIHCWASPTIGLIYSNSFIVPCQIDPADFVAADDVGHCVFTKIKVDLAQVRQEIEKTKKLAFFEEDCEDEDDSCDYCGGLYCDGECQDEEDDDYDDWEDEEEEEEDWDDDDDDDDDEEDWDDDDDEC